MKAKFYTYRNLNCGISFSTKHRGIVRDRFEGPAIMKNVELRVSAAGNKRAKEQKKRNVHAFVVSENLSTIIPKRYDTSNLRQIRYNPFNTDSFVVDGKPINGANEVLFQDGKLFLLKP